jgi:DNA recombination protein RmuC
MMSRKLRDVEALPGDEASGLLGEALSGVEPDES